MLNQPTELVPTQRGLPAIINGSRRVDATAFKNSKMEARMQSLAGTMWRLIEASAFDEAGQVLPSPLAPHPIGFAICEAERVIVTVSDGRTSLPPDVQSRAFSAYTGAPLHDHGRTYAGLARLLGRVRMGRFLVGAASVGFVAASPVDSLLWSREAAAAACLIASALRPSFLRSVFFCMARSFSRTAAKSSAVTMPAGAPSRSTRTAPSTCAWRYRRDRHQVLRAKRSALFGKLLPSAAAMSFPIPRLSGFGGSQNARGQRCLKYSSTCLAASRLVLTPGAISGNVVMSSPSLLRPL
jgi:hypothetical protein